MSQPYTTEHRRMRCAFDAPGLAAGQAAGRPTDRHARDDHRVEQLIRRLPEHRQPPVRWLRSPTGRWVRLPLGILFILGSFLFILPIFGLWMLPVGVLLLAEDVPVLRRLRTRVLNWIERHRPHWFSEHPERAKEEETR